MQISRKVYPIAQVIRDRKDYGPEYVIARAGDLNQKRGRVKKSGPDNKVAGNIKNTPKTNVKKPAGLVPRANAKNPESVAKMNAKKPEKPSGGRDKR